MKGGAQPTVQGFRMLHRLQRLQRLLANCVGRPGAIPVWWHVGRPNFGDDINPTFFRRVGERPVRFAIDRDRPHLFGAGSILERATPASIVCGSGLLRPPVGPLADAEIVAVRGALSLAACRRPEGVWLGDPLVLVDAFAPQTAKRHRFGFVPHVRSTPRWRRLNAGRRHLIHPGWRPWRVIEEIASCDVVFSQSLHGLIVADALGIPNVWVAPADSMTGGRFKFDDYFSTLDAPREPVAESPDIFGRPEAYPAAVGRYRFSKADYRRVLAGACDRLARRLADDR